MKNSFTVAIMAAGLGTRMKSDKPKVLHTIYSKPLIIYVLEKAISLKPDSIVIIVGYQGEKVKEYVEKWLIENKIKIKVDFVFQKVLRGSGRAIYEALEFIKNHNEVLILSGDVPFVKLKTLKALLKKFYSSKADCAILTCEVKNPKAYGRILRDEYGNVKAIVESSDATETELKINEINSGVYFFNVLALEKSISNLQAKGPKKEYYLTDSIENIVKAGGKVVSHLINDENEIKGINSKKELSEAFEYITKQKIDSLIDEGVTVYSPNTSYIAPSVKIGKDTIIYPGCFISGKTVIGKNCKIGPYAIIEDSKILDDVEIKPYCCVYGSLVKQNSVIGPFSHIRPLSKIGPNAKIGNFSEVKKSTIGMGSKVPHLSYIGDTFIGKNVNVGAGTITCNYDGVKKNKTFIGDEAFIGSNTNLVAPIKIGKRVLIGAGSTITENVPDDKLAIARARQVVKEKKR